MKERREMSRRTSWTLIICAVVLGLTLPMGAHGAVGTIFNLSDRSKTGPDGDARITNNKLGTAVCDTASAGMTTGNCARVISGRLSVAAREPTTPFTAGCNAQFPQFDTVVVCDMHGLPASYVLESTSVVAELYNGEDLLACSFSVISAGSGSTYRLWVDPVRVGVLHGFAQFVDSQTTHLRGSGPTLQARCRRDGNYSSTGFLTFQVTGYGY